MTPRWWRWGWRLAAALWALALVLLVLVGALYTFFPPEATP